MQISKKTGWIAIIGFILVIFFFSQQNTTQSNNLSKSITKKILMATQEYKASTVDGETDPIKAEEQLAKQLSKQVDDFNNDVRKIAHYSLYVCFSFILIWGFGRGDGKYGLLKTFFLGAAIAAADEVHQKFVPGRTMQASDFVLDVLGVLTAIVIVGGVRVVRRWITGRER